ncbi:DUF354 domain-containing protein [uncultured Methanolobus sp.]|uniref:DUF354 domain-containing protein n=1 Tax=uncultured Methanolobus sp. TaxID=218300 RepID=UPI002AAB3789|nr:DUF354 domain-containing protein [uncultured Methanolobus sp.]
MRIMIGVAHPKHVHFRKNLIKNLITIGHDVRVVARDKDLTFHLLKSYHIPYESIGEHYRKFHMKIYGVCEADYLTYCIARKFKPDLLVGGSPYLAHAGKLLGIPHIGFSDTENTTFNNYILHYCSSLVCTPSSFKNSLGSKRHVLYDGFEELAYLHPNYFTPDRSILEQIGVSSSEKFIVVRFVEWDATHDKGAKGFTDKLSFVKEIEKYGKVYITSERDLPPELEKNRLIVSPEKIHDLMYYASLFIGESSSMACESAVLGTPSIYLSTSRRGYIDEMESLYGLVFNFSDSETAQSDAFKKALEILKNDNNQSIWQKKREKMLADKIDVTQFLTELVDKFPDSKKSLKDMHGITYDG